ncbi:hypothetical protein ACOSQ3_029261 [Xanthoceras sorbifolium]
MERCSITDRASAVASPMLLLLLRLGKERSEKWRGTVTDGAISVNAMERQYSSMAIHCGQHPSRLRHRDSIFAPLPSETRHKVKGLCMALIAKLLDHA